MNTLKTNKFTAGKISPAVRKRIEVQGYLGLDAHSLSRINYWLRLTPALCMTWALTGIILRSPFILWLFVPLALLSAIVPVHPFDYFYNTVLRHVVKGPRLPRFPKPRRFSCLLAATMVSVAALSIQSGWYLPVYIIGSCILLVGLLQLSRGLCIPSLIYGFLFGKPMACKLNS